jgi:hypothetical protein
MCPPIHPEVTRRSSRDRRCPLEHIIAAPRARAGCARMRSWAPLVSVRGRVTSRRTRFITSALTRKLPRCGVATNTTRFTKGSRLQNIARRAARELQVTSWPGERDATDVVPETASAVGDHEPREETTLAVPDHHHLPERRIAPLGIELGDDGLERPPQLAGGEQDRVARPCANARFATNRLMVNPTPSPTRKKNTAMSPSLIQRSSGLATVSAPIRISTGVSRSAWYRPSARVLTTTSAVAARGLELQEVADQPSGSLARGAEGSEHRARGHLNARTRPRP